MPSTLSDSLTSFIISLSLHNAPLKYVAPISTLTAEAPAYCVSFQSPGLRLVETEDSEVLACVSGSGSASRGHLSLLSDLRWRLFLHAAGRHLGQEIQGEGDPNRC